MKELIKILNPILEAWKIQFDVLSQTKLEFTEDEAGWLVLNDAPLCREPPPQSVLSSAHFNAEEVSYYFEDGNNIRITISWPENEIPCVSSVVVSWADVME